ncbi:MAG: hypothetical protein EBY26_05170 [Microbacteriaceae bacterium]|nr:hypothetical protein [Microbacteriaceae bacterium]
MPMVRSQPTGIGDHASTLSPRILRPLLEIPQSEIESYAEEHQLSWIIDESNADTSFDRNFLRHEILPILGERFPSYRTTDLMVALGTHLIAHERGKPLPVPEIVPVIGEVAFLPVHNNDEFPNEGTSGIAEPEDIA